MASRAVENFRQLPSTRRSLLRENFITSSCYRNLAWKIKNPDRKITCRKDELGFVVTFWVCAGMKTKIRGAAENFGEEFFRAAVDCD